MATQAPPKAITVRARCRLVNPGAHKDEFVFTLLDSEEADYAELRAGITDEQLREAIEVDTEVELTIRPTAD